jgi:molecular chaperone DnaK
MKRRTIDFGIDLGTTNSEIACVDKGEVKVFKNYKNEECTPSAVRIDEKGSVIVGRKAYDRHVDDPENTEIEFKRWMGGASVKEFKASGRKLNAEELSAEVLRELKSVAKTKLEDDEDITAAVITVPCNFKATQCEATQRAAQLAGIKYAPLLQEPIAASIAYGFLEKMPQGYWAVYDLGGGTFDIAIMSAKDGRLSVVDHCGDNHLGGKDFDWRIVENIVYPVLKKEYFLPELGRGNKEYGSLNAILKRAAEETKIELTHSETADIVIYTGGSRVCDKNGKIIDISIPLKRADYEALIAECVKKTAELFEQALKNQGLSPADITQLLLVGGPTMTPYVRSFLKNRFKIPIDHKIDPLTVVAQGAAIFAASQIMPDEYEKRDRSKVFIKLAHPSMTTEKETLVGGKLEADLTGRTLEDLQIQISRLGGDWQSGKIEIKDGSFFSNVSLRERKLNTFQLALFDRSGNKILIEPESFSITQGISIAQPPLIKSIGVELSDGAFDKIVEKGTSLPCRSKIFTYHTVRAVRPGESGDALKIHVREGESSFASRNQHLGTLLITGKQVNRPILEGSTVEIIISVDQSRLVTAEAYIESIDQRIKDVLKDKTEPEINPDKLAEDLGREEKRFNELEGKIESIEDSGVSQKLADAGVEKKIQDIKADIQAAKGGDQDAIGKADSHLKDLQILLDPIEHLTQWPAVLDVFRQTSQACSEVVTSWGSADDKDVFGAMKKDGEQAVIDKDVKRLEKIAQEMTGLQMAVLFRQDGFWISLFQNIRNNPEKFTDKTRAHSLIGEGNMALQRQDLDSLRTIVQQLYALMPQAEQELQAKLVSDSGIRKSW